MLCCVVLCCVVLCCDVCVRCARVLCCVVLRARCVVCFVLCGAVLRCLVLCVRVCVLCSVVRGRARCDSTGPLAWQRERRLYRGELTRGCDRQLWRCLAVCAVRCCCCCC